MVVVKSLKFFERFVLSKIQPEKVFGDNIVRKQAFLDNINMHLKKKAKLAFLSMILVKKLKFFHVLCLSKIDREKIVCWRSRKKRSL